MANFIAVVYGTLKANGIDTSKMSTDEAIKKFNELQGGSGKKESPEDVKAKLNGEKPHKSIDDVREKLNKSSTNSANKGYSGYSMSKRAKSAYEDGEMPLSKWNKDIVQELIAEELGVDFADVKLLKPYKEYLSLSSWHHTGKFYNKTDFYKVDLDMLKEQGGLVSVNGKDIYDEDKIENERKMAELEENIRSKKGFIEAKQRQLKEYPETIKALENINVDKDVKFNEIGKENTYVPGKGYIEFTKYRIDTFNYEGKRITETRTLLSGIGEEYYKKELQERINENIKNLKEGYKKIPDLLEDAQNKLNSYIDAKKEIDKKLEK